MHRSILLIHAAWSRRRLAELLICLTVLGVSVPAVWAQTSAKGIWGNVTPIADNNHPNLLYNQTEIDQLRTMVLVNHTPAFLWTLYQNEIAGTLAIGPDPNNGDTNEPFTTNDRAALSYMLEPTQTKANAIRTALLAFMSVWPNGGGIGGEGDDWWQSPGWGMSGPPCAWMFDLIQAYHPTTLSGTEKTNLKEWFRKSARYDPWHFRDQDGGNLASEGGKTVGDYANWWANYMLNRLPCALVSGNQAAVDFWADSGWPHTRLTYDGSNEPPSTTNRFDLVMYLLTMFPSGAIHDSYVREHFGSNGDPTGWNTECGWCGSSSQDAGGYHHFNFSGVALAAEMAYHNGMTQVYSGAPYQQMLAFWRLSAGGNSQRDYRSNSLTGHPDIARARFMWVANRRFGNDTLIKARQADIVGGGNTWVNNMDESVWPFFGFPSATEVPPPPPSTDPIAFWKMEEGSGTTVVDSSGNNHPLTLTTAPGPTFQPGIVGSYALSCPGNAGYAESVGAFTNPLYTWMLWLKAPVVPSSTVVSQPIRNGSGQDSWGFSWSHSAGTSKQAAYHQTSSGTFAMAQLTSVLQANLNYHIATTYDGTNLKIYLNGQLQATTAAGALITPAQNFHLCGLAGFSEFAGLLDQIKIWNRALSAAEIATEYSGSVTSRSKTRHRVVRR
jgi:hypothetical protein